MRESPIGRRRQRRGALSGNTVRAGLACGFGLLSLPLAGCCTIAGWFCGPDRSRWVSQDYREPDDAVATFLEAVRRENTRVIHESLGEDAKRRYGLPGILESTLAWERLKEEVPGLHLAGTATPSPAVQERDGRVRYDLAVAGRKLVLWLVEQPYWLVAWRPEGELGLEEDGRYVDPATFRKLVVVGGDLETTVDASIREAGLPLLAPGELREVRLGHDWKVDEFRLPADQ